jgi:hypothetical protein
MADDNVNEVLLLLARGQRRQLELLDHLAATVHALREFVVSRHPEIERMESEAKAASSSTKQSAMRALDDIIQKLDSQRPPRVN